MENKVIKKPEGYKSHFIVNDPHPILIVNVSGTAFQKSMDLGKELEEFEVTEDGENLVIKKIE